jgi:hypothetical protein
MMGRPAEETTVPSPFARDLGYLKRFLTALEAHADTLADAPASSLRALLAEEGERWGRIEALLDGAASGAPLIPADADLLPTREGSGSRSVGGAADFQRTREHAGEIRLAPSSTESGLGASVPEGEGDRRPGEGRSPHPLAPAVQQPRPLAPTRPRPRFTVGSLLE